MQFNGRNYRPAILALLSLSLLFGGCASGGIFGNGDDSDRTSDNGRSDRTDRTSDDRTSNDTYDRSSNDRVSEVSGRVDRIDDRNQVIYVEASGVTHNNLRNAKANDQTPIYYDDRTPVRYEGKTYQPGALEEGDRVVVDVDDSGSRLYARDIEVTYDVSQGDSKTSSNTSSPTADRNGTYDRNTDRSDSSNNTAELRGKVRWIDQDRRIMELEDTSWGFGSDRNRRSTSNSDVVEVYYDSSTAVEYNGHTYKPENLERGDQVQVEVRDTGSRYETDQIEVVENSRN